MRAVSHITLFLWLAWACQAPDEPLEPLFQGIDSLEFPGTLGLKVDLRFIQWSLVCVDFPAWGNLNVISSFSKSSSHPMKTHGQHTHVCWDLITWSSLTCSKPMTGCFFFFFLWIWNIKIGPNLEEATRPALAGGSSSSLWVCISHQDPWILASSSPEHPQRHPSGPG